jgi:hypothetical protein
LARLAGGGDAAAAAAAADPDADADAWPGASFLDPKEVLAAAPMDAAAFWPVCAPPPPVAVEAKSLQMSEQMMKQAWVGWRCPSFCYRSQVFRMFASRGK